ncbi:hypothetical protein POM88_016121 [Heracleum sosnowskyi]|uniref:Uncharacterized protein n=1 Tax=Heracleum sosnowskyi TaxID=360622 RepID=A0AAD8IND5_9APIA|nr:hypothetical protein POM88_016121 [Heracleum sosnowskyi]
MSWISVLTGYANPKKARSVIINRMTKLIGSLDKAIKETGFNKVCKNVVKSNLRTQVKMYLRPEPVWLIESGAKPQRKEFHRAIGRLKTDYTSDSSKAWNFLAEEPLYKGGLSEEGYKSGRNEDGEEGYKWDEVEGGRYQFLCTTIKILLYNVNFI